MYLHHFTNRVGYNAIRSQKTWTFKAKGQRADRLPDGTYFTPLWLNAPAFYPRTRVPNDKRGFHFSFDDVGDLKPFPGDRGQFVLYSPVDYPVEPEPRRGTHGTTDRDVPAVPASREQQGQQ